ncbi:MAG: ferritin family protein [Bacteroidales bacterium]|nr:ferritin family protein [Bacteroidales bacterium]
MERQDTALEILKTAILLERQGKAFYTQAARNSKSPAVKQIFEDMAEEENEHIQFLTKQAQSYVENHQFIAPENHPHEESNTDILTQQVKKEIDAASFEAAAISAAINFENKAIDVYAARAKEATSIEEKAVYTMLAEWERGHHHLLHRLSEDLKEEIWNDNNFWPF